MDDTPGRVNDPDRRTQQIRDEIEETRAEMSETVDAIQDKLSPRNIVANARDRMKSAAGEKVRDMTEIAGERAQQAMDYTRRYGREVAERAWPYRIPLALIGAGVGVAWVMSMRGSSQRMRYDDRDFGEARTYGRDYDTEYGSNWEVGARTREYASSAKESVRRMARRRSSQLQHMIQDNPLLVGAGALVLGVAFGLAVPETETENEWMGETRDNLVESARDKARETANQVQSAASSVADAAGKIAGQTQQT